MKEELMKLMMERIKKLDAEIDKQEDTKDKCMLANEMVHMANSVLSALWEETR